MPTSFIQNQNIKLEKIEERSENASPEKIDHDSEQPSEDILVKIKKTNTLPLDLGRSS